MSYGRHPYYIIGTQVGGEQGFEFFGGAIIEPSALIIKYDAMAQFVASMWWRQNRDKSLPDGEMGELIKRGYELRPDLLESD